MNFTKITLIMLTLAPSALMATPADDVVTAVRQFFDAFNNGDMKSVDAGYDSGNISIVDEFAPHVWTGQNAGHAWADAYEKHAEPTRAEVAGHYAYVCLPAVYAYKECGKPIEEDGQMTVPLHLGSGGWKVRSWTWSGAKPHPAH